jgi:hypothetical protein
MALFLSPADRKPAPDPLPTNDSLAVISGIVIWGALLVVGLFLRGRLVEAGHGWWLWVPAVGMVLGMIGLRLVPRRR